MVATLPLYQVGRKCGFHSQSAMLGMRTAFALYRAGTALATIANELHVHNDEARKRKRGIERLGKRQATTPHRPVKRHRLLEAQWRKYGSIPLSANGGVTWPF